MTRIPTNCISSAKASGTASFRRKEKRPPFRENKFARASGCSGALNEVFAGDVGPGAGGLDFEVGAPVLFRLLALTIRLVGHR